MAILSCPGCSHKLRVPDNKRGKVTCPLCGSEWFHPEVIELSSVEFRCSASGAKFNVISSRRSPLHKFTVQKIEKAVKAARPLEVAPAPASLLNSRDALPVLAPAKGRGGWLARIVGSKEVVTPKPPDEVLTDRPAPGAVSTNTNDAAEYSWSGFSCPYCSASSFVFCHGGHLACDGTAQTRKDGRFHQCFCGNAGFITGSIKTFENERISVKKDAPKFSPVDGQGKSGKKGNVAVVSPAQHIPAKQ